MPDTNHVIAVYNTHTDAEQAVAKLNEASFDVKKVSIIGKDYHTEEKVVGYYTTGDRMRAWGGLGAFWGGIWGLLFGAGFFLIPGLGPVLVAGPFLAALVGALESAVVVGGASALVAGLVSLGIPKDSALKVESEIAADRFVVAVHGTEQEVAQAELLLGTTSPVTMEAHSVAA
jgi:Heat induced stress protein YflT domain